jgi:thioredoxin reductase (NADPH)
MASRVPKVTMLVRGNSLKDTLSQYLVDRICLSPNIEVRTRCTLVAVDGDQTLERITYRDLECDEEIEMETNWLFVCIGGRPRTEWTDADMLTRDSAGYILTGSDLLIRAKSIKRCATAVGEGAAAVSFVHQFLAHEASVL